MTCPNYDAEKSFGSVKHLCKQSGFLGLFTDKKSIDNNHAEQFCLTKESFWNGAPKYKDCPYYK